MPEAGTVKVRKCDIHMFSVWESGCSGFWPSLLQPGLLDPQHTLPEVRSALFLSLHLCPRLSPGKVQASLPVS